MNSSGLRGEKLSARQRKSSRRALPSPSPVMHMAVGEKKRKKLRRDVAFLPMDIWTMILLRVPAVNLVKFKVVCKAWHELIISQKFAQRHLEHWTAQPINGILLNMEYWLGFDCWNHDIFYLSDLNCKGRKPSGFLPNEDDFTCRCYNLPVNRCPVERVRSKGLRVLASCDGLTLICYAEQTHYQLFVCNPITGSYRRLPVLRLMDARDFDLWAIPELYEWAVVHNASTGQYEILGMEKLHCSDRRCYVFELQGGCEVHIEHKWKELRVPLSENWSIETSTTKDNRVYWLAVAMQDRLTHHTTALLSIDIYKEKFTVSFSVRLSQKAGHYFASRGRFYCIEQKREGDLMLSTLENFDTKEWTECRNFLPFPFDFQSLSIEHVAMLGDTRLVMCFSNKIYVFDMISEKFGRVELDPKHFSCTRARKIVPHISSLVGCI